MSPNKFLDHFYILPEDGKNRQLANGYLLCLSSPLDARQWQVLRAGNGWQRSVEWAQTELEPRLRQNPRAHLILLVDFDSNNTRRDWIMKRFSADLHDRIFVLGVWTEPEELQGLGGLPHPCEKIGTELGKECLHHANTHHWQNELLRHNQPELERFRQIMNRPA